MLVLSVLEDAPLHGSCARWRAERRHFDLPEDRLSSLHRSRRQGSSRATGTRSTAGDGVSIGRATPARPQRLPNRASGSASRLPSGRFSRGRRGRHPRALPRRAPARGSAPRGTARAAQVEDHLRDATRTASQTARRGRGGTARRDFGSSKLVAGRLSEGQAIGVVVLVREAISALVPVSAVFLLAIGLSGLLANGLRLAFGKAFVAETRPESHRRAAPSTPVRATRPDVHRGCDCPPLRRGRLVQARGRCSGRSCSPAGRSGGGDRAAGCAAARSAARSRSRSAPHSHRGGSRAALPRLGRAAHGALRRDEPLSGGLVSALRGD